MNALAGQKREQVGLSPKWKGRSFWFILAGLGALLVAKDPSTLLHPTFWAEECSVYYRTALNGGPIEGLLQFYHRSMRFELIINLAVTVASFFPMRFAPHFTAVSALSMYLIAFGLLLRADLWILNSRWQRLIACFGVLVSCYSMSHVFLSTAVVQQTCGVIGLILLLANSGSFSRRGYVASVALLGFCGLSGLYAIFLAPAFLFKTWYVRSKRELVYLITIGVCGGVQLLLMLSTIDSSYTAAFRGNLSSDTLGMLFLRLIMKPILGQDLHDLTQTWIGQRAWIGVLLFCATLGLWTIWVRLRANDRGNWLLLIGWLCATAGISYGAVGAVDNRYAALSRAGFFLFMVHNITWVWPIDWRSQLGLRDAWIWLSERRTILILMILGFLATGLQYISSHSLKH